METKTPAQPLDYKDLFLAFFKAGAAFGGGLGIMAALERELVHRRQVVSREDFLATYSLGRLVPSGTMTAVAVAYGYRFGGPLGTVIAVGALVLPGTVVTLLLTLAYTVLQGGQTLDLLSLVVLPAALALIVGAALKFGKEVFRPSLDLLMAAGAFVAAVGFNLHPSLILLAGGVLSAVAFRPSGQERA